MPVRARSILGGSIFFGHIFTIISLMTSVFIKPILISLSIIVDGFGARVTGKLSAEKYYGANGV
jgi:hypothetical protein